MFGDDKSLILPIVYDIANLVRNSAKKYIEFDYNLADFGDFSKTKISYERRNLDLTPEEEATEDKDEDVGTLPATAQMTQELDLDGLEEFMSDEVLDPKEINEELETLKTEPEKKPKNDLSNIDMDEELEEIDDEGNITDPLNINHELQKDVPTLTLLKLNQTLDSEDKSNETISITTPKIPLKRVRRSLRKPKEFVHKLVRSVPFSLAEENVERSNSARNLELNTTAFASPKESKIRARSPITSTSTSTSTSTTQAPPITVTPESETQKPPQVYEPYQLIEDIAFASLNGSEVFLDDSDIPASELESEAKSEPEEILPTPEELIAGPRYRVSGNKLIPMRPKVVSAKRKRVQVRARPKQGTEVGNGVPAPKKCERFTASMCLKTDDYPM